MFVTPANKTVMLYTKSTNVKTTGELLAVLIVTSKLIPNESLKQNKCEIQIY